MRFNEAPGRVKGVQWIEIKDDDGNYVPQGYVVDFSSWRESFALVAVFVCAMLAFAAAAPPKHSHAPWPWSPFWMWTWIFVGMVSAWLRWNMDDYRVVDAKTKKIWLHQRFFGTVSNTPEVDFSECAEVVVAWHDYYHKGQKRTWKMFLVMRDGSAIQLTDSKTVSIGLFASGDCPEWMRATASRVSKLIGIQDDWRAEYQPYRLR